MARQRQYSTKRTGRFAVLEQLGNNLMLQRAAANASSLAV